MNITEQSIKELESVLAQYEKEKGDIDLDVLNTTDCQTTICISF
jgi:hypothetical protein